MGLLEGKLFILFYLNSSHQYEFSVPSMVSDLTDSAGAGLSLDSLMFGGAPAPGLLPARAGRTFPTTMMSVGLTSGENMTYYDLVLGARDMV